MPLPCYGIASMNYLAAKVFFLVFNFWIFDDQYALFFLPCTWKEEFENKIEFWMWQLGVSLPPSPLHIVHISQTISNAHLYKVNIMTSEMFLFDELLQGS